MSTPAWARPISPRVAEALDHLCRGATRRQTARAMGCSEATVKNFLQIGYQQLGVHSNVAAALLWSQIRMPEATGQVCARCSARLTEEDRLLEGGRFE